MLRKLSYQLICLLLCVACSNEVLIEEPLPTDGEKAKLCILLPGQTEAGLSRAADDETSTNVEGNESTINSVTLFHASAGRGTTDATRVTKYALTIPVDFTGGYIEVPTNMTIAVGDKIYAIANNSLEDATISTVADIKNATIEDEGIFNATSESSFIMSAEADVVATTGVVATFDMKRLAAKIRLNLTLGDPNDVPEIEGREKPVRWSCSNLQLLLTSKVGQSYVYPSSGETDISWVTTGEPNKLFGDMQDADVWNNGGPLPAVTAYTYEHIWNSSDVSRETKLVINIPYYYDSVGTGTLLTNNYYTVHITDDYRIERNTLYDVFVTVSVLGSQSSTTPVVIEDNNVELYPWAEQDINIPIQNDYLYVQDNIFRMVTDFSFFYKASGNPQTAPNNVYFSQGDGEEDYGRISGYKVESNTYTDESKSGIMTIAFDGDSQQMNHFDSETPKCFYVSLTVGTIIKPLRVYQFPQIHFAVDDDYKESSVSKGGTKHYNEIVVEYGDEDYPIGTVTEIKTVEGEEYVTTINQVYAQESLSPHFVVDSDELTVENDDYSTNDKAQRICLDKQKESKEKGENLLWRLPTLAELKLMNEAASSLRNNVTGTVWEKFGGSYYAFGLYSQSDLNFYIYDTTRGIQQNVDFGNSNSYKVRCVYSK